MKYERHSILLPDELWHKLRVRALAEKKPIAYIIERVLEESTSGCEKAGSQAGEGEEELQKLS